MKKKLLILLIVNAIIVGYSQEVIHLGMAGGSVGFEDPFDSRFISMDTNNVWFITTPQKNILFPFDDTYTNSLVTDTALYYKNNVRSSFNFRLCFGEGSFYTIQFFHKYDFEKNKDGGIVETSYDNGIKWQNIIYDTVIQNKIEDIVNFYDASDIISSYGNQPGFTGLQSEYKGSGLRFTARPDMYLDTMLLRFTISTDSVNAHNEGWMLDDFSFGGSWVATKEFSANSVLMVYPNPAKTLLFIESAHINISQVSVVSRKGDTMIEETGDNITSICIAGLIPGYYFITCRNRENKYWVSKFIKI